MYQPLEYAQMLLFSQGTYHNERVIKARSLNMCRLDFLWINIFRVGMQWETIYRLRIQFVLLENTVITKSY